MKRKYFSIVLVLLVIGVMNLSGNKGNIKKKVKTKAYIDTINKDFHEKYIPNFEDVSDYKNIYFISSQNSSPNTYRVVAYFSEGNDYINIEKIEIESFSGEGESYRHVLSIKKKKIDLNDFFVKFNLEDPSQLHYVRWVTPTSFIMGYNDGSTPYDVYEINGENYRFDSIYKEYLVEDIDKKEVTISFFREVKQDEKEIERTIKFLKNRN